eukprot:6545560-Alexandrium_andersonii.AAC.1
MQRGMGMLCCVSALMWFTTPADVRQARCICALCMHARVWACVGAMATHAVRQPEHIGPGSYRLFPAHVSSQPAFGCMFSRGACCKTHRTKAANVFSALSCVRASSAWRAASGH